MNIYVDIDNTLFNFLKQYSRFYQDDTGIPVDWRSIYHYNLGKTFNATKYKYLYDPTFYDDIEEMPMGIENVIKLHKDNHKIYFCTACVTEQSIMGKYNLLKRTFDFFHVEDYIVMSRKENLYDLNGVIIDDSPFMFNNAKMPITVCYAWKHNEQIRPLVDLYTDDWREIYTFISGLSSTPDSSVAKSLLNLSPNRLK